MPASDCHHVRDTGVKNLIGEAKQNRKGEILSRFPHHYLSGKQHFLDCSLAEFLGLTVAD